MKVVIDDCRLERMDAYTDPLNDKIKRQAAEITRLLMENDQLKQNNFALSVDVTVCKSMVESARAAGEEAAWKLAQKIFKMDVSTIEEIFIETGAWNLGSVLEDCTYAEAAAKVAEWERKKEEICVGDVVTFYGKCGLVTFIDQQIRGISESGLAFSACKEDCTKTGRHIDVNAWLAQIGGDCNG